MNLKSLWSTLNEADAPIDEHAMMGTMKISSELNLPSGWFTWVAAALLFGAEPITTETYMCLFPYGWARLVEERFASAAQQGYLVTEDGKYRLSEKGAGVIQQITQAVNEAVAQLQPMSAESLGQFVNYLIRLADASSTLPEPPTKWLSTHKRRNMNPGEEASLPRLIIYYFDQVAAYRGVRFRLGADRATASRCNDCKVHLRGLHPETEMHPIPRRCIRIVVAGAWSRRAYVEYARHAEPAQRARLRRAVRET